MASHSSSTTRTTPQYIVESKVVRTLACIATIATSLTAGPAWASFGIGGNPTSQTSQFSDVVRILDNSGAGSGSLVYMRRVGGTIALGFLTADHVIENASSLQTIGFGNTVAGGGTPTINLTGNIFSVQPTIYKIGTADIDFIGAKVNIANLNAAYANVGGGMTGSQWLLAETPLTLAATAVANHNITSYGFGITATRDNTNFDQGQFDFVHHIGVAAEGYGTQRTFNNRIAKLFTYNDGTYNYTAEQWLLDRTGQGAIANEGTGMPGDSGAPIIFNGEQEGVLTSQVRTALFNNSVFQGYGVDYKYAGWGDALTNANINLIRQDWNGYAPVPEFGSMLSFGSMMGLGLGGALLRRRAKRAAK